MNRRIHFYLKRNLRWGSLHFTLIDPEKQPAERAAEMARAAQDAGSHAILVGGSTGVTPSLINATVREVKGRVTVPVILFPAGADGLSPDADAVLYMTMLNSKSPRYLMEEQVEAAERVEEMGLEVLPMGYIVVAPGGRVGEVGQARLVPRDDPRAAVKYALAAQYLGMDYVYLEAGSGASEPVPAAMIREVSTRVDLPIIAGGGIRTAEAARNLVAAGADILVTGNVIEGPIDVQKTLTEIIRESITELKKKIREAV